MPMKARFPCVLYACTQCVLTLNAHGHCDYSCTPTLSTQSVRCCSAPRPQVAEWVARILAAGDAFAGPDAGAGLRALLTTQVSPYHQHQAYPLC